MTERKRFRGRSNSGENKSGIYEDLGTPASALSLIGCFLNTTRYASFFSVAISPGLNGYVDNKYDINCQYFCSCHSAKSALRACLLFGRFGRCVRVSLKKWARVAIMMCSNAA